VALLSNVTVTRLRRENEASGRNKLLQEQLEVHLIAAAGHPIEQTAHRPDRLGAHAQGDDGSHRDSDGDPDAKASDKHGAGPM